MPNTQNTNTNYNEFFLQCGLIMISLKRETKWYRPYYAIVNDRQYKVDNLKIYQDGKILVATGSWFENERGRDIEAVSLPGDQVILRRKEKFDGTVCAMTHKESYGNETLIDVYIPADMLNIHFTEYKIIHRQLKAIYKGEQDICIQFSMKCLDTHKWSIEQNYEDIYKQVDGFALRCNTEDNGENLLSLLAKMKELVVEYITEKKRVANLTVEEVLLEMNGQED